MAYSKVILNGATIMDVTQDTVAAENLLSGETATRNDGVQITGTYEGGGGQWYDYRIDITISGSTVTADYNGATLTEIATAYADDPSTGILAVIHGADTYETRQAMVLYASYNTSWGDMASSLNFISFIYDQADDKYFVRRIELAGSGNSTSKKAM